MRGDGVFVGAALLEHTVVVPGHCGAKSLGEPTSGEGSPNALDSPLSGGPATVTHAGQKEAPGLDLGGLADDSVVLKHVWLDAVHTELADATSQGGPT